MLDIDIMGSKEIQSLLQQVGHGHLGCAFEGRPYVVPMHYYLEDLPEGSSGDSTIYIFTTEGQKTQYMEANPQVCLQVEAVKDPLHWRSVVVTGRAERLTEQADIDRVTQLAKERNPTLSPAVSRIWIDAWGRENRVAIYRIHPSEVTGNQTSE
ncbi:MAG: pyridoxamine 5'-phosphate oxidase family protein [Leptolyngbya foveolarum]|uniref:Pyridoxamine 5'-phosphate oxidase family protein n=1 Tax=Leptolyngbya foveolarum TaxID=47253 RepID=A0A2W4TYX9_9CYAN|nr:MAG: pyridoxamine 5'-phosphate oxidase family protein [Leptolyngbya foveolarum]